MDKKITFGSHFGTIAAVGGSVIGLGNIWRFPYLVGSSGGSAFLIVYILCSLLIAVPIMMSELLLGRHTRSNPFGAFRKLSEYKIWSMVGLLGIITVFCIFAFYSVVAGWAISFFKTAIFEGFTGHSSQEISSNFKQYINTGWQPSLAALIFIVLTAGVVIGGIKKGIERINKILMPVLLVIIVGLFIYSFSLDGFSQAMNFLLQPDFSKIGINTIFAAFGQAFFSMSLGMGAMIAYGAYVRPETSIPRLTLTIALADLTIALLAGFAIFPGVFTYGIEPTSGPTLIFETLPLVFSMMPAGNFIGIIFFFLVFIAAITSSVSMLEPIVQFVMQELNATRAKAVVFISTLIGIAAVLCAYSQVENSSLIVFGENIFDFLNDATAKFSMPIGAFLIVIFTGWVVQKDIVYKQITNDGRHSNSLYFYYRMLLRYFIPAVLGVFILTTLFN
ncbi:MAG: sodium-dependent transporter [Bacteroidetes bacterium]|nr:sodium-dependent transporter [Bacteroidota bacterium]